MRRNVGTMLCLALLAVAWTAGGAGDCRAQCCDESQYCGELEYCGYYDGCDANGRHGGHLHNKAGGCCVCGCCQKHGWDGQRRVSYQCQRDLFYNYYAQPGPFYNTPGKMYVCPQPVPPNVGHTYVSYQPFMPHEYLYRHQRSYYNYNPGAGWTRTNVRYGTCGNTCQKWCSDWHYPMSSTIWPGHQDFHYPGLRF